MRHSNRPKRDRFDRIFAGGDVVDAANEKVQAKEKTAEKKYDENIIFYAVISQATRKLFMLCEFSYCCRCLSSLSVPLIFDLVSALKLAPSIRPSLASPSHDTASLRGRSATLFPTFFFLCRFSPLRRFLHRRIFIFRGPRTRAHRSIDRRLRRQDDPTEAVPLVRRAAVPCRTTQPAALAKYVCRGTEC